MYKLGIQIKMCALIWRFGSAALDDLGLGETYRIDF
jgi:hypothetical protein